MGTIPSRTSKAVSPGMTADSIEKYYEALAKHRASCAKAANDESHSSKEAASDNEYHDCKDSDKKHAFDGKDSNTPRTDAEHAGFGATSDIIDNAGLAPGQAVAAKVHLDSALRALNEQKMDDATHAITALAKLGLNLNRLAKVALERAKGHPWETATVVIPLVILACTPAILGIVGFGASGIAAGSIAAGIQAGIGNVVAGSTFAVLTSAGMGGGGAIAVVLGLAWGVPTAALGSIVALKWWSRNREAKKIEDASNLKHE